MIPGSSGSTTLNGQNLSWGLRLGRLTKSFRRGIASSINPLRILAHRDGGWDCMLDWDHRTTTKAYNMMPPHSLFEALGSSCPAFLATRCSFDQKRLVMMIPELRRDYVGASCRKPWSLCYWGLGACLQRGSGGLPSSRLWNLASYWNNNWFMHVQAFGNHWGKPNDICLFI